METVAVIMSTYNGGKYLAEQLDSILAQQGVNVELFIRDDGSGDNTRAILTHYADSHSNIHIEFGENLGFVESFLYELKAASGFSYYAFSDQDDVWKPAKLITAVKAISLEESRRGRNIPVVWQCNCLVTDENLSVKRVTVSHRRKRTIESFMMRGHARGCAMVINAEVRKIIKTRGYFNAIRGHDSVSLLHTYANGGSSLFEREAFVFYRQRGNNITNTQTSLKGMIVQEITRMFKSRYAGLRTSKAVLETYGDDLDPKIKRNLTLVAEHNDKLLSRLRIMISPSFSSGIFSVTVIGRIKAFFGWL